MMVGGAWVGISTRNGRDHGQRASSERLPVPACTNKRDSCGQLRKAA